MTFISDQKETQLILDCLVMSSQRLEIQKKDLLISPTTFGHLQTKQQEIEALIDKIKPADIMSDEDKVSAALEIIKEESERSDVRKYTCCNLSGYSQFERNIAERILSL